MPETLRERLDVLTSAQEVVFSDDGNAVRDVLRLRPITDGERAQLLLEADLHPHDPEVGQHCRIVLALARGQSAEDVAEAFGVDDSTVYSTIELFNEAGAEGLFPEEREVSESTATYLTVRPIVEEANRTFVERMSRGQTWTVFALSLILLTPFVIVFYGIAAGWIPYRWLPAPWDDSAFTVLCWLFLGVTAAIPVLAKTLRPRFYRTASPAETHYQRAVELQVSGDTEGAIEELDKSLAQDPDFHAAYFLRGSLHNDLEHGSEAVADFSIAIRSKVELASSFYGRAVAYMSLGDRKAAIDDLSRTIRIDPTYAVAYYARGICFRALDQVDKALNDFDKYIELDPENPHIYMAVAETLFFLGPPDRLHWNADRVIALDPTAAKAYRIRGWANEGLGQWDLAMIDLNRAIELGDVSEEAYFIRGIAATKVGDRTQAAADVETLKSLPESERRDYFIKELREFLLLRE